MVYTIHREKLRNNNNNYTYNEGKKSEEERKVYKPIHGQCTIYMGMGSTK